MLLALAASAPSSAQSARLTVLADSVSAGAPFEVAVTVTHGPGRQVTFPVVPSAPEAGPLTLGDARALGVRRLPPAVRGAARVDSAVYRAVVFTADSARVGPLAVRVGAPSDSVTARTGSALVPVRSVLRGEAPPYEPAPVGPAESFASAAPLWVAFGLLAALSVGVLAWALRRRGGRAPARAAVAPYPTAVARLDALDRDAPADGATPEAIETHVVAVRAALRDYLGARLGVPAREATSSELLARLGEDARVTTEAGQAVRSALQPADLVAFARVRPGPDAVARLRGATRAAVEAVERSAQGAERVATGEPAPGPVLPPLS